MAGAGKKTFTAGEVLTASDVNTYLMEQSIMVFGGTAARSSAIPTPSEGMTTYQTDKNQIDAYNGSAWVGMGGLQLIKTQTIGTGVSSVTVTGAFSADYDNYKIIISGGAGSQNANLKLQLGSTTSNYKFGLIYLTYGSPLTSFSTASGTNFDFVGTATVNGLSFNVDLLTPFAAKNTFCFSGYTGGNDTGTFGGTLNDTTSYTAFTITAGGGTLTGGTIYVFGYAK